MLEERPSCRQEPKVSSASRNAKPVCQVLAVFGRHASPATICSQRTKLSTGVPKICPCSRRPNLCKTKSNYTGGQSARSPEASVQCGVLARCA
jgi:hypothetical protein